MDARQARREQDGLRYDVALNSRRLDIIGPALSSAAEGGYFLSSISHIIRNHSSKIPGRPRAYRVYSRRSSVGVTSLYTYLPTYLVPNLADSYWRYTSTTSRSDRQDIFIREKCPSRMVHGLEPAGQTSTYRTISLATRRRLLDISLPHHVPLGRGFPLLRVGQHLLYI